MHHGHQKGIIHRDLKPDNILVDAHPGQPKIIDFGVARATDSDMAMTTMQTDVGQLIGTVQYMSPEQCEADPARSRHAERRLRYELLTGKLPYAVDNVAIYEATRIIREKNPKPLTPIRPELRGNVETIVLKALEKERDRRYQSADEMSKDITSHLAKLPIMARPPSLVYQIKVFARRNKILVAGIIGVFIALIVGMVGTTTGMIEARRKLALSVTTLNSIRGIFENLDAEQGAGPEMKVLELIEKFEEDVDEDFASEPEVKWIMHDSLGHAYRGLAVFDKSETHYRTTLELLRDIHGDDPNLDVAQALEDVAAVIQWQGRDAEALPLHEESLAMRLDLLPEVSEEIAMTYQLMAVSLDQLKERERALELGRKSLAIREQLLGPDDALIGATQNVIAAILRKQGKTQEAADMYRDALRITREASGEASIGVATIMGNLGHCLRDLEQYEEAEANYLRGLELKKQILGEDHLLVGTSYRYIAVLYELLERFDEAAEAAGESLRIRRIQLGDVDPLHRRILQATDLYARVLAKDGVWEDAADVYRDLIELRTEKFGSDDRRTGIAQRDLGYCLFHLAGPAVGHPKLLDDAETTLLAAERILETNGLPEDLARVYEMLIELYTKWDQGDMAMVYGMKLQRLRGEGEDDGDSG